MGVITPPRYPEFLEGGHIRFSEVDRSPGHCCFSETGGCSPKVDFGLLHLAPRYVFALAPDCLFRLVGTVHLFRIRCTLSEAIAYITKACVTTAGTGALACVEHGRFGLSVGATKYNLERVLKLERNPGEAGVEHWVNIGRRCDFRPPVFALVASGGGGGRTHTSISVSLLHKPNRNFAHIFILFCFKRVCIKPLILFKKRT